MGFFPETGYLESNYDKELCPKRTSFNMYFEFHVLQLTRFCKLSSSYFTQCPTPRKPEINWMVSH